MSPPPPTPTSNPSSATPTAAAICSTSSPTSPPSKTRTTQASRPKATGPSSSAPPTTARIYGFQIATTREEDERFIAEFNDRPNVSHFNLFFRNCADFSKALLNSYYPHAIRRNIFVDLGITTPKQVARSLTKYARRHPELTFSTFVIPQVPGSIHRSHPINGVVEALVKSKKYVVPLVVLNPQTHRGHGRRLSHPWPLQPAQRRSRGADPRPSRH